MTLAMIHLDQGLVPPFSIFSVVTEVSVLVDPLFGYRNHLVFKVSFNKSMSTIGIFLNLRKGSCIIYLRGVYGKVIDMVLFSALLSAELALVQVEEGRDLSSKSLSL